MNNTAEVLSTGQVLITEATAQVVEIAVPATPAVVEVATAGPKGASGVASLAELEDVNTTAKVNGSVLAYDSATSRWVGNDANTIVSLTDGGNF